jgi:hypothetical protein
LKIPNILEVIYAPHKAFKKIGEKPSYIGPTIIVLILAVASFGFAYVVASRTYVEASMPNGLVVQDEWTQNSTLWVSNGSPPSESNDSISGLYYGNSSIAFTVANSTQIWMWLNNVGPVNCSSQGGFNQISFRLKQLSPQDEPQKASIFLFSPNTSDYFYYDFTQYISNSTVNTWNNLTLPVVSGWLANGANADWSQITGLKLEFDWTNNSNTSMLVDGLFFHGGVYLSGLEIGGTSYMINNALASSMTFVVSWVVFAGLLFLLGKNLGGKVVWKLILVAVGLILFTMVVQTIINIASYTILFHAKYPFAYMVGVLGEGTAEGNLISEQNALVGLIDTVTQLGIWVWTGALGGALLHFTAELSWAKSALASGAAYLIRILLYLFFRF